MPKLPTPFHPVPSPLLSFFINDDQEWGAAALLDSKPCDCGFRNTWLTGSAVVLVNNFGVLLPTSTMQ
jgi:hypothetical protein